MTVPVFPFAESETDGVAVTLIWSPDALDVHEPPEYVPLSAERDTVGFEYDRNETDFELEFVLPRESVTVTAAVRDPAANALEDVTSAPVAVKALLTEYDETDAPLPAEAEETTLNFVYPPTYKPLVLSQALELTGYRVIDGAVGFIELLT